MQRTVLKSNPSVPGAKNRLPLGALATSMLLTPLGALAADETTLPQVNVQDERYDDTPAGYQGGTTRVGKTEQLAKDVPQAVSIVSQQLIEETNANTLKEALRHVSGLTFNAGEGGCNPVENRCAPTATDCGDAGLALGQAWVAACSVAHATLSSNALALES